MIEYTVMVKGDAYSMRLYECDNLEVEQVEDILRERNCLEPEDYELIVYETEE